MHHTKRTALGIRDPLSEAEDEDEGKSLNTKITIAIANFIVRRASSSPNLRPPSILSYRWRSTLTIPISQRANEAYSTELY